MNAAAEGKIPAIDPYTNDGEPDTQRYVEPNPCAGAILLAVVAIGAIIWLWMAYAVFRALTGK